MLSGTTVLSVVFLGTSLGNSQPLRRIGESTIKRPELVNPIRLAPQIVMERVPLELAQGIKIYKMRRLQVQPTVIEQLRLQQNLLEKPRVHSFSGFKQPLRSALTFSPTRLKTFVERDQPFTRLSLDEEKGYIFFLPRAEQLATHRGLPC